MIGVLFTVCALIIIFFIVFQKRKNKLLLEKIEREQAFQEEISITQIEIQEQTLKNIGQELHDNVGQILSVANMNMSILAMQVPAELKGSFSDTKNAVKDSLSELRALSKTLNSDVISNRGFQESITGEINRLNKLKLVNATIEIVGDPMLFTEGKQSIILFRILQECISNTVKYAQATVFKVVLNYTEEALLISAEDNGKGFDMASAEKGSGLINMKNRAELINSEFKLTSSEGNGMQLQLEYPYQEAFLNVSKR
ncbi:histidine kinase [Bizionia gelidisalsuginis]|uniref:histidine kinase n=3 Tax=Flavobacteriaceae TaxID=49546 RepID=A0A8H2QL57_9FLAO|nr:histidine kinase [Bizionia saleffrena]TYC14921.1 histidine kinase [Bizionia gelidisalsuginis]